MDAAKNFAKGTLSTGYDDAATSIVLVAGDGAKFPAAPFNAVWWNATDYSDPADDPTSIEIVRVTAKSTDTFTVIRGQEGTGAVNHNAEGKTYKLIAPLTAKVINSEMLNVARTDDDFIVTADALVVNAAVNIRLNRGMVLELLSTLAALGDFDENNNGTRLEVDDNNQKITLYRQIVMPNLPTTNPAIAGALWNDSGTLKISAG